MADDAFLANLEGDISDFERRLADRDARARIVIAEPRIESRGASFEGRLLKETSGDAGSAGSSADGSKGDDGSGGGGGPDNLEEVTGAVSGVASTLMVQTDGNGWTAI